MKDKYEKTIEQSILKKESMFQITGRYERKFYEKITIQQT